MPCFDKKLEASRTEFANLEQQIKDVDLVLTPIEIQQILDHLGIEFSALNSSPTDSLFGDDETEFTIPSGS